MTGSMACPQGGAVIRRAWPDRGRWLGLLVATLAAGILVTAALLPPASAGLGTHRQLGLPACNWIVTMDLPCPSCGMTTAFSHTVRGQWLSAFMAQPFGMALCLVTAMVFVGGIMVAITGAPLGRIVGATWNRWWTWGLILLAVGAWAWKIALHRGVF